ncbi:MAG TPA: cupredoxin family protein [Burkholderiales bacterium]|nr:cupredoxin family protein [Burkholderiales bacterium]
MKNKLGKLAAATAMFFVVAGASGHGDETRRSPGEPEKDVVEKPFGRSADAKKATRTIRVDMSDRMRFTPEVLSIKRGETVRFLVKNSGKTMHEMVLGTMQELKEHAELMRKFPAMEHDEPYMAHVKPGNTEALAWQFTKTGEFFYGCLVPGHFEAGMLGRIVVR